MEFSPSLRAAKSNYLFNWLFDFDEPIKEVLGVGVKTALGKRGKERERRFSRNKRPRFLLHLAPAEEIKCDGERMEMGGVGRGGKRGGMEKGWRG